jgi:hypothetical protein
MYLWQKNSHIEIVKVKKMGSAPAKISGKEVWVRKRKFSLSALEQMHQTNNI